MPENFGARLRQRREERGIDLLTIAKQTKIKPALLDGLERDDVSQWPSGLYRRAFIRGYAHAIALDPDVVVREFLEVHPEPPEVDVVAAMASTLGLSDRNTRPTARVRNVVDLAISSLSRLRRTDPDAAAATPALPPTAAATVAQNASRAEGADMSAAMPGTRGAPLAQTGASVSLGTMRATEPVAIPGKPAPSPHIVSDIAPAPATEAIASNPSIAASSPGAVGASTAFTIDTPMMSGSASTTSAGQELPSDAPSAQRPLIPPSSDADLLAVAHLCTELALVGDPYEVQPLLQQAARLLDATGIIVWLWDASAVALRPAIVHGYSPRAIAQLPMVRRDADNATALGFRSAQLCEVPGTEHASGALVVPLLTAAGCVGVLAVELQRRIEQTATGRALATILAAFLAQMTFNAVASEGERVAIAQ